MPARVFMTLNVAPRNMSRDVEAILSDCDSIEFLFRPTGAFLQWARSG